MTLVCLTSFSGAHEDAVVGSKLRDVGTLGKLGSSRTTGRVTKRSGFQAELRKHVPDVEVRENAIVTRACLRMRISGTRARAPTSVSTCVLLIVVEWDVVLTLFVVVVTDAESVTVGREH